MAETNLGRIVGSRIYTGTQPSTALDGDIYINTSGEMYVYDGSSSKWTDYASLKGESGTSIQYYYHTGVLACSDSTYVYITYISQLSAAMSRASDLYDMFGDSILPAAHGVSKSSNSVIPVIAAYLTSGSSLSVLLDGVTAETVTINSYSEIVHVVI